MKKRKKLTLSTLKIKSFVTNLNKIQSNIIKGGNTGANPTGPGNGSSCPPG